MASIKLAANATIADIITKLDNPVEYVRSVLGNMLDCNKEHGEAFVRIGTTGRGIVPHYRVEPKLNIDVFENDDLWAAHFVAFHGRNHKRLDWGLRELRVENWSRGNMSYKEVQNLLGTLRGYTGKKI